MGSITFFVAWQLWEKMTFVLACAIVATFFAGLIKLWWTNRSVRKHELLDEEKKTRISEMRCTGLPVMKKADIPFGVRAIQSGIQVDGIWISRPGTPNSSSPLTMTPMPMGHASEPRGKGKGKAAPSLGYTEVSAREPSPAPSIIERDAMTDAGAPSSRVSQTYTPSHGAVISREAHNASTLRQLEGQERSLNTYVPSTLTSSVQILGPTASRNSDHFSTSSDERGGSVRDNPRRKSPFPNALGYGSHPGSSDELDRQANPFTALAGGSEFRLPTTGQGETAYMYDMRRSFSSKTPEHRPSR